MDAQKCLLFLSLAFLVPYLLPIHFLFSIYTVAGPLIVTALFIISSQGCESTSNGMQESIMPNIILDAHLRCPP